MSASVDWSYLRKGWTSCQKAQGYLARKKASLKESVDAGRSKMGRSDALRIARDASRVLVAKGKNLLVFDMRKNPPTDQELLAVMLGPTGNLRAPTVRKGSTVLVGFHEAGYDQLFG